MPILSALLTGGLAIVDIRVGVRPSRSRQLQRMNQTVPQPVSATALIDTGSSCTLLDTPLLTALGLTTSSGQVTLAVSTGALAVFLIYDVSLTILHPMPRQNLWLQSFPVLSANLAPLGVQALVGSDILDRCVFIRDGLAQRFLLTY